MRARSTRADKQSEQPEQEQQQQQQQQQQHRTLEVTKVKLEMLVVYENNCCTLRVHAS